MPSLKYRAENALLECQYELNNKSRYGASNDRQYRRNNYLYYDNEDNDEEVLYSVKWYKDGEEFYRFVPRSNPPQSSYSFDGIKVDVSAAVEDLAMTSNIKPSFSLSLVQHKRSNSFKVFLRNVSLKTSGKSFPLAFLPMRWMKL